MDKVKARIRNKRYRDNLSEDKKAAKRARDKNAREEKKRARIDMNKDLERQGKKICSRCFSKKSLTEYSYNKRTRENKLNSICDVCLIKLYKTDSYSPAVLTPSFWRKKAYSCNTTAMATLRKTSNIQSIQDLPGKVSGEDLVKLFDVQKGACIYCRLDLADGNFHIDHVEPLSSKGFHGPANIQILCPTCNRAKYVMSDPEFRKHILKYAQRILRAVEHEDKEPHG